MFNLEELENRPTSSTALGMASEDGINLGISTGLRLVNDDKLVRGRGFSRKAINVPVPLTVNGKQSWNGVRGSGRGPIG
jgi:hypothetical protein